MDNKDLIKGLIAEQVKMIFGEAIKMKRKMLNRPLILVDTESEKEEIMSCIDSTLKKEFPAHTINVFRIDLATIQSMSELSYVVFHKIYESQDENTKAAKDFYQWLEDVKKAEGVIGSFGMAPVISVNQKDKNVNFGYGLFVFDNLDKANDGVLDGVKGMYHDGRNCIIPLGWEFISFCRHDAKIDDPSLRTSRILIDFNEEYN